jgi:hypothetical protein
VLGSHPDADAVMQELSEKVEQASWSYRFASNTKTRRAAIRAMGDMVAVLPTDGSRQA